MIGSLPVPISGTWGQALNDVIIGIDSNYLRQIDSITASSTIPGVTSGTVPFTTIFQALGVDLGNLITSTNLIISGSGLIIKNMLLTGSFSITTSSGYMIAPSGSSVFAFINGLLVQITGTTTVPSSSATSYIIYASSTATTNLTVGNGVVATAALISSTYPITGSNITEVGLAVVNSSTSCTFIPVSPFRTFVWTFKFPTLSTSAYNANIISNSLFIPFGNLQISSYVVGTGSAVTSTFANPQFMVPILITSTLGYTQLSIGATPILFPSGTITSAYISSIGTSTSGTVTSITSGTITSTVGVTAFLAAGSGTSIIPLTPVTGTVIIRW